MAEIETDVQSSLRAIVRYTPNGPEIVETTDTISEENGADASTLELFRAVTDFRFDGTPFGRHEVSIHRFDDILVVHVPDGENAGVVATFEPDADGLNSPIDHLLEFLRDRY
ncbi:hypothetical protein OB955_14475 [Halobacteria archaeon AArc-m2/3/4]|uniref:Halobacterial output domain-containing protein n=1 Tax=Natronoglomus mannanivorans TaxID=2979990 RepID=A0ABT2QG80_9EURY|nr:hypothetical protein [Halobacteria archaeon AArc-m2/3/4]